MDSLTLQNILKAFNSPVNEEQAWAICYQCARFLLKQWEDCPEDCFRFNGVHSVNIQKDGSLTTQTQTGSTEQAETEYELVQSLGVVVFQALDYGLGENEEQKLSPPLESLIERMTGSESDEEGEAHTQDDNEGDEGIEHDAGDDLESCESTKLSLNEVLSVCSCHLQNALEANTHYKAVCRALVAEAIELSSFLEKISTARDTLRVKSGLDSNEDDGANQLDDLGRADWARLWIQCLRELRQGIKLKKVEHVNIHSTNEFELTPYEILMEDIRSRRYTLRQVMVNGQLPPNAKKSAHDLILEFIRSRPPLHPVKERQLKTPPPQCLDVREQLLASIRQDQKLKPTPGRIVETSRTKLDDNDSTPLTSRKIIKPDPSLFMGNSFDDDDDDDDFEDDEDVFDDKNRVMACPLSPMTPLSPHSPRNGQSEWQQTVGNGQKSAHGSVSASDRRHSITVCESPLSPKNPPMRQLEGGKPTTSRAKNRLFMHIPNFVDPDFSSHPRSMQASLECLSLTIDEVMHIRQVLTKAELECLLVDLELHQLVAKGKICFTCKTTKFSIFGQWGTKCKFCKRNVCTKCVSKMAIPTEHFEHIPVYTLSPSPLSPNSSQDLYGVYERTGSVPNSPEVLRKSPVPPPRPPLPDLANNNKKGRPPLQRSQTTVRPPAPKSLEGPLMNICKDCKAMIINIIRASRMSLASTPSQSDKAYSDCPTRKAPRNFRLDLKPVYKKQI